MKVSGREVQHSSPSSTTEPSGQLDLVELLLLLALPEYELLILLDLPLFDDDDDSSYFTKSPKAAVLVDLLADEFDDEPTPTPMAAAMSAAINRNPNPHQKLSDVP